MLLLFTIAFVPYIIFQLGVDFDERTADMREVKTRGVFEAGKLVLVEKVSSHFSSPSSLLLSPSLSLRRASVEKVSLE